MECFSLEVKNNVAIFHIYFYFYLIHFFPLCLFFLRVSEVLYGYSLCPHSTGQEGLASETSVKGLKEVKEELNFLLLSSWLIVVVFAL